MMETLLRKHLSGLTYLAFCLCLVDYNFAASFYGDSYIVVPLHSAQRNTILGFQFKTQRSSGLLLLAAGKTDYLVIELTSGRIKASLDLGSGVAEVHSYHSLQLNDNVWHSVTLQRTSDAVTLIIDKVHQSQTLTPGSFFELNISYGLHVGSVGQFDKVFLGNFQNFRGCMANFTFNGMDVFEQALAYGSETHHVEWQGCDSIFDATSSQSISFIDDNAFALFGHINARQGGIVSFDIKTQASSGIVMYSPGAITMPDFFALELVNGLIKLSLNQGNGHIEVYSKLTVNDGLWHHISASFAASIAEVSVDGVPESLQLNIGGSKHLDLTGHLYVGGIDVNNRKRAIQHGLVTLLSSIDAFSLSGCVHNIKINNKLTGFEEMTTSLGIKADCLYVYTCLYEPCIEGAMCQQHGVNDFICKCPYEKCTKSGHHWEELSGDSNTDVDVPVIAVHPLKLDEGTRELITSANINVIVDYQNYGISNTGVIFKVISQPNHGTIEIKTSTKHGEDTFTIQDLNLEKITYIHDGSEASADSLTLELLFVGGLDLPPALKRKHTFTFSIEVMPVNDPPRIILNSGNQLHMVAAHRLILTSSMVQALDVDTPSHKLMYTVWESQHMGGYFQHESAVGHRRTEFTQKDIDRGKISFVHLGGKVSCPVLLTVTDGIVESTQVMFKIIAHNINLRKVTNTGVSLPHHTDVIIHSENLTFTNGLPSSIASRDLPPTVFHIVNAPKYGRIEKMRNIDGWIPADSVLQKQIDRDKIRYIHVKGRPSFDSFAFTVTCGNITSQRELFEIEFMSYRIDLMHNTELVLNNEEQAVISTNHLQIKSTDNAPPLEIVFTLLSNPRYGYLVKGEDQKFVEGANFTQADIDAGLLSYRFDYDPYTTVHDNFEFRVAARHAVLPSEMFFIRYKPDDNSVKVHKRKLQVLEGAMGIISKDVLWIESKNKDKYLFEIIQYPSYGMMQGINRGLTHITDPNITIFTSQDLKDMRIIYQHDDSEHDRDVVQFTAAPVLSQYSSSTKSTNISLQIEVILRNDNPPVRVINKVFHVVYNGERLLTIDDICYMDPDKDFNDDDLEYTRRGMANGDLVRVDNPSKEVYRFTQRDLKDKKLLFRHSGADYDKTVIQVTDGLFYSTGLLEIRASDPFLSVVNNTGVECARGSEVIITNFNLSVETNVNANPADMAYTITRSAVFGTVRNNGVEVNAFTQADINAGIITYVHDDDVSLDDSFEFVAKAGRTAVKARFLINVFLPSIVEPPKVIENRTIVVREGSVAVLNEQNLKVVHPAIDASRIVYNVKMPPTKGILRLHIVTTTTTTTTTSKTVEGGMVMYATKFTQADIDNGNVEYVQTEPRAVEDAFIFDVTNGIKTVRNLVFDIEIIPSGFSLQVVDISVKSQGSKLLSEEHISIPDISSTFTYYIINQPVHGWVENMRITGQPLTQFTSTDLQKEVIYYVHNDSMTSDSFSIKAQRDEDKAESSIQWVNVTVKNLRDEVPKVIHNTGLTVWAGSETPVTRENLLVKDEDNRPDELKYEISNPRGGYVAVTSFPEAALVSFTQEMIDSNQVMFVQKGSSLDGGFTFTITDGVNVLPKQEFIVTANLIHVSIAAKYELRVVPGSTHKITRRYLRSVTDHHVPAHNIDYVLVNKPEFGEIIRIFPEDGASQLVDSFTQGDVDKELIAYRNIKVPEAMPAKDAFSFDISAKYGNTIYNEVMPITISPEIFSEMEDLLVVKDVEVLEGATSIIMSDVINLKTAKEVLPQHGLAEPEFVFQATQLPVHGVLKLKNIPIEEYQTFTFKDMENHHLTYHHDHSDSSKDKFKFILLLEDIPSLDMYRKDAEIDINVIPMNDQPFVLLTQSPRLEVVQGYIAAITQKHLETRDPDTPAEKIRYEIRSGPSVGKIYHLTDPGHDIHSFTQADVDNNALYYEHDGSIGNRDAFYFRVSDGLFPPQDRVFIIDIIQLMLKMVNFTDVKIMQGEFNTTVTCASMGAATNGHKSKVLYNVTGKPQYGLLIVNGSEVTSFSQVDVDSSRVFYVQTDSSVPNDNFIFTVSNPEHAVQDLVMNITVQPLLYQSVLNAAVGGSSQITLDVLDASRLADLTGDDPKFMIQQGPLFGKLVRIDPKKRSARYAVPVGDNYVRTEYLHSATVDSPKAGAKHSKKSANYFSQSDIEDGNVFYEVGNRESLVGKQDSFSFMLMAPGVQPATGSFTIQLQPPSFTSTIAMTSTTFVTSVSIVSTTDTSVISTPYLTPALNVTSTSTLVSTSTEHTSKMPSIVEAGMGDIFRPRISEDDFLIIGLVCGVVLIAFLAFMIVAIFRCRSNHLKEKEKEAQAAMWPHSNGHIEHLHDDLDGVGDGTPSTLHLTDNYAYPSKTEISRALPQCRVTPLVPRAYYADTLSTERSHSQTVPKHYRGDVTDSRSVETDSDEEEEEHDNRLSWDPYDPDLQHSTQPALRNNQYWV